MGLWTYMHTVTVIPAIAAMIIIGFILRFALKDKPLKTRMIPFQILASIAIAIEIGKQVVSLSRGYDLYHLPFHFCSLFIFALPVMAFYNGKHRNAVTAVTTALSASLFLLMLIYPNLIYSEGNIREFFCEYMSFHTVAFHNIVMLEFLLIIFLELHTPDMNRDSKPILISVICFCIISASMAQILKTNYANYYTCNIPAFESIRTSLQNSLGYVLTQSIYIIIVSALNVIFVFLSYWLYRLAALCFRKKFSEN